MEPINKPETDLLGRRWYRIDVYKGDKLYVEGRLRYRSYDDKKGMRRYVTEIYADNMELLTPRSAHDAAAQAAPGADKAAGDKQADDKDNLPF